MSSLARTYNTFMFFKLPSAWWCGVRLRQLTEGAAMVSIRHKWFNQNPFRSIFWAAQGMAAEFSTGALVMYHIKKSGGDISMLVANNRANFSKKATGKITFSCTDGAMVGEALQQAIKTGEGQTFWMTSVGTNTEGIVVSTFEFEWTVKQRAPKN